MPGANLTGKPPGITNEQASHLGRLCRMLGWPYEGRGMTSAEAATAIRQAEAAARAAESRAPLDSRPAARHENVRSVISDGHVYERFKRALDHGHLLQAMAEASDISHVPLEDALALVLMMEAQDDHRYGRAAARWVGRFALECRRAEPHDLRRALNAFDALPDPAALRTLEELARMATR